MELTQKIARAAIRWSHYYDGEESFDSEDHEIRAQLMRVAYPERTDLAEAEEVAAAECRAWEKARREAEAAELT